ncbi:MarR family transcriptional regulator [Paenibacillus sp. YPG26]|uniref:MarR family winged helix-turn-helix transcriptional regulator n=1 Tax=Paenibacillus sp. YPG26 TaxID=2878915 RepID=UPI00203D9785|nr:MarR family transcriptional regulator [Paenibacillus sp. YPG26]USB32463.1 MarR family transcriptional regulator [Paenibacillus sp. YPG26]
MDYDGYIDRIEAAWKNTIRKMESEIMVHRELGLTGPQFHMLGLISKEKSCNISYLAEKLDVKPSAITVMIDRLVQSNYVARRHDEQDRRAVLVSVTAQGEEVLKEARKKSREIIKYYFSHLDANELDTLVRVFEKFAAIEKPSKEE